MPKITVLLDRDRRGWTGDTDEKVYNKLPLWDTVEATEGLTSFYDCDAHFVCYHIVGENRIPRLRKKALPVLEGMDIKVQFNVAALDIDHSPHGEEIPDGWRKSQIEKLETYPWFQKTALYHTKGGYRLLCRFAKSINAEDFNEFLRLWCEACKELNNRPDTKVDKLHPLSLYRLPFVNRGGVDQRMPTIRLVGFDTLDTLSVSEMRKYVERARPDDVDEDVWNSVVRSHVPFKLPTTIEEGTRNDTLFRYACFLRNRGCTEETMLDALMKADRDRCDPQLQITGKGLAELKFIANRVASEYEQGKPRGSEVSAKTKEKLTDVKSLRKTALQPTFERPSEVMIAEWVSNEIHDNENELVFDQGTLRKYVEERGIWEEIPFIDVKKLIATLDGAPVIKGVYTDGIPKMTNLNVGDHLMRGVTNSLCVLRSDAGMFDNPPPGIVFKNGFVHVTKGGLEMEENDKSHLALSRLETEFVRNPECPLFDKFLDEVLIGSDAKEKKAAIWEMMGASLAQLGTEFQKAAILVGEGANGKSVLLKIWSEMIPKGRCTAIAPQDMDSEYNLAHMKDSLLNRVNEAPPASIGASAIVKAVISGDVVQARHIRQAPFEFIPRALHIFACNELPAFKDLSEGFARRWMIISFDRSFTDEEQDAGLAKTIIENELDAIICKSLIAVGLAFQRGHYIEPISSQRNRRAWFMDNDPISTFIEEVCETAEESVSTNGTSVKAMYAQYKMWCSLSGIKECTKMGFTKRMRTLRHMPVKTGGTMVYKLKIKP